jgi:hypothetical protein
MDAINAQLTAKGLRQVTENADIGIVANGAIDQKQTLDTFYDGFGGPWGWRGWDGMATTETNTYDVGTLVVDIFDNRSKRLIWRGIATDTLSDKPEKNTEKLNKAVEFPSQREGAKGMTLGAARDVGLVRVGRR